MLVGLSGVSGSGKDAVGSILREEQGFRRVSFADKVRELLYAQDPQIIPRNGYSCSLRSFVGGCRGDWAVAQKAPAVRRALQDLGMAVRDVLGPDVWINAAFDGQDFLFDDIVVTDVRFPNEAAAVRERGGRIWYVDRPGTGPVNSHVSENALTAADADVIIKNTGTLHDLQVQVLSLV